MVIKYSDVSTSLLALFVGIFDDDNDNIRAISCHAADIAIFPLLISIWAKRKIDRKSHKNLFYMVLFNAHVEQTTYRHFFPSSQRTGGRGEEVCVYLCLHLFWIISNANVCKTNWCYMTAYPHSSSRWTEIVIFFCWAAHGWLWWQLIGITQCIYSIWMETTGHLYSHVRWFIYQNCGHRRPAERVEWINHSYYMYASVMYLLYPNRAHFSAIYE